ncbi:MAG: hypothetical protein ACLSFT_10115 [Ruminococcus callidus]
MVSGRSGGEYDYRFYFSNTVDSMGTAARLCGHVRRHHTIEKATVYDGGMEFDANVEPTVSAVDLFCSAAKEVAPDETF